MTEIALLKMAHVLGLVYWLGGDLGVFYTSFYVIDEKRSVDVRVAAAKILFALDQGPRICMTLMLPLGVQLANSIGFIQVPGAVVAIVWLIALGWLAMVLYLHFAGHSKDTKVLTTFDFWFRVFVIVAITAVALLALISPGGLPGGWIISPWAAYKLIIFAGLVGSGLMIRIKLKPFGAAFGNIASGKGTPQDNAAMNGSLARTRPFALLIWAGLLVNTALGLHVL